MAQKEDKVHHAQEIFIKNLIRRCKAEKNGAFIFITVELIYFLVR